VKEYDGRAVTANDVMDAHIAFHPGDLVTKSAAKCVCIPGRGSDGTIFRVESLVIVIEA
jgi:hypothetical protein